MTETMSATFDVYTRVSAENGRSGPSFGSPEEQEAACRVYAVAQGWDIDEVVYEGNVSGATPVDKRDLGRLIHKVERGESAGILVRHLDRFGRDMVEGILAYKRIDEAGGIFVAVADSLDSRQPGTKLMLNMRLAMAEEQRDKNREARIRGKMRAVDRGMYGAPAPTGYVRA
jgi:DNA invertase Pin-like site-specific DNA recombinase